VQAFCTWYINDSPRSGRQYKLYYPKNPVTEAMNADDLLFIAKTKDDKVFIIIANSETAKNKLLASFNEKPITDTAKEEGIKEVGNVVAVPLQVEPTVSWKKVYFTPGPDCENNIISRLSNAKTIDIAVYSITNENIVNAIIAAHKRGAKVRVMTDKVQAAGRHSRVKELIDAGVPVRFNVGHRLMHNKFAIFDGREMKTGSFNWTHSATHKNSEDCMFFRQEGSVYSDRYEYLWKLYERGHQTVCR
jgi:phosphatidylserine/phosphatidylglycerophosphate/cardiolipin synthase-like enzyme